MARASGLACRSAAKQASRYGNNNQRLERKGSTPTQIHLNDKAGSARPAPANKLASEALVRFLMAMPQEHRAKLIFLVMVNAFAQEQEEQRRRDMVARARCAVPLGGGMHGPGCSWNEASRCTAVCC